MSDDAINEFAKQLASRKKRKQEERELFAAIGWRLSIGAQRVSASTEGTPA
jgi:hypothetical protein